MPLIRLSDSELDAVFAAARPLPVERRDAFLQAGRRRAAGMPRDRPRRGASCLRRGAAPILRPARPFARGRHLEAPLSSTVLIAQFAWPAVEQTRQQLDVADAERSPSVLEAADI
jgi:hypothetical protein